MAKVSEWVIERRYAEACAREAAEEAWRAQHEAEWEAARQQQWDRLYARERATRTRLTALEPDAALAHSPPAPDARRAPTPPPYTR